MAIDAAIRSGVNALWTAGAERLKAVTYRNFSQGQLNPATGLVPQTVSDTTGLKVFFSNPKGSAGSGDQYSNEVTCYIRASDLPVAKQDDKLIDHNGTTWNVAFVGGDPDFYHELTLRR
jgi:hypothetical protein